MDSKKNLKPELKEVYERVMNTQPSVRSNNPVASPQSTASSTPPPAPDQPAPIAPAVPESAPPASPEPFLTSSAPHAVNDSSGFIYSSHGKKMPHSSHKENRKEEAKPVQKLKESSPHASVKHDTAAQTENHGKKQSNLLPVLLVLMVIFLGVYALFWAFFFEII